MSAVLGTTRCAWRGDFSSGHSLAIVNGGLVGALERLGVEVERLATDAVPLRSDAIGVAAHWPPVWEAPTDGLFAIYQPWEFGEIPAFWAERIRARVDEVWTASEYSRRSYLAGGIAPELVHVVPNGIDLELFHPDGAARRLPQRPGTVFLFVGGTTWRKGIDVLLGAYGRAFTASDDVLLVIKGFGAGTFYRGQTAEALIDEFRKAPGAPALEVIGDEIPYTDLPALYRASDCVVQPYRGEGFCLPALEALACGKPLIATAGGPTDEFASEECAWRIDSRPIPLPVGTLGDLTPAGPGSVLEPSVEALVEALRAATNSDARAAKASRARSHAERFSWNAAALKAFDRLQALAARTPIRSVAPAIVPGARRLVLVVDTDWQRPESWEPAVDAYAAAFGPDDETTLVLPALDEADALARVSAHLAAASIDADRLADLVLANPTSLAPTALELGADAYVCPGPSRPLRARRIVPPDPSALRALLAS